MGSPATASMTSSTISMMMAVPEVRLDHDQDDGDGRPGSAAGRRRARPSPRRLRRSQYDATARITATTANSDGWSWIGPMVNQRAAPWALELPTTKTPSRAEHDQAVEHHGDGFEPPVVEEGHHHHGDHPEHHEERLLLEVGLGVLTLGQQGAPGGGVDHDHADQGHQHRRCGQDDVEEGAAAPSGSDCSGRSWSQACSAGQNTAHDHVPRSGPPSPGRRRAIPAEAGSTTS